MPTTADLSTLVAATQALHKHLCPRQILGIRMGVYAGELLGVKFPQTDKRIIAFVETDGCFTDGIMVATGCSLGHRTMRLMDQGKVAVTMADTETNRAVRIWPSPDSRVLAARYAPEARSSWHAQLDAYQRITARELLCAAEVTLQLSLSTLVGQPGVRVTCESCGEEILNRREQSVNGRTLCVHCAGETYWTPCR
jgi:formylmethanofuran dehydrogenase subunit E